MMNAEMDLRNDPPISVCDTVMDNEMSAASEPSDRECS